MPGENHNGQSRETGKIWIEKTRDKRDSNSQLKNTKMKNKILHGRIISYKIMVERGTFYTTITQYMTLTFLATSRIAITSGLVYAA